jgi:tripartite-type tricarboxylate transporter receptor subunit TctC
MKDRAARACGAALALAGMLPAFAYAQSYPQKPVRFIVPYAAGGAGDIFARTIAQKLSEAMGQQFIVDNRPGANGIIGMELVAKSPPDGYTIVMGNSAPMVLNPSLYAKLPYDPIKGFAPVTQGTLYPYILIVHPSIPVRSVAELVKLAKAQPGQLQYGSSGNGGANHLAGEIFKRAAGVNIVHVPFKGSAPALADVLGGQISMMFDTIVTTVPQLQSGKVRALAVTGAKRAPQTPDVPDGERVGLSGIRGHFVAVDSRAREHPACDRRSSASGNRESAQDARCDRPPRDPRRQRARRQYARRVR